MWFEIVCLSVIIPCVFLLNSTEVNEFCPKGIENGAILYKTCKLEELDVNVDIVCQYTCDDGFEPSVPSLNTVSCIRSNWRPALGMQACYEKVNTTDTDTSTEEPEIVVCYGFPVRKKALTKAVIGGLLGFFLLIVIVTAFACARRRSLRAHQQNQHASRRAFMHNQSFGLVLDGRTLYSDYQRQTGDQQDGYLTKDGGDLLVSALPPSYDEVLTTDKDEKPPAYCDLYDGSGKTQEKDQEATENKC